MLRRFSSKFGKDKKEHVNGTNGPSNGLSNGTSNGITKHDTTGFNADKSKLQTRGPSSASPVKESTRHPPNREAIQSAFAHYAQVAHASQQPMPSQSGDGSPLDHSEPSGLIGDIKSLGFKDAKTLVEVMKSKATGELQDDKTYIMERTIQVS